MGTVTTTFSLAPGWPEPPSKEKRTSFYGGAAADSTADVTFTGMQTSGQFGAFLSGAGDLNHDSFDDVIVGEQSNDFGALNSGRAYVFFGGVAADDTADIVFAGVENSLFGGGLAGVGDLTGDGFPDLAISARGELGGDGRVYVYDVARFHLLSPNGGETWAVGSTQNVSWLGQDPADLWLSTDGGFTYQKLRTGVGGYDANYDAPAGPARPDPFLVGQADTDRCRAARPGSVRLSVHDRVERCASHVHRRRPPGRWRRTRPGHPSRRWAHRALPAIASTVTAARSARAPSPRRASSMRTVRRAATIDLLRSTASAKKLQLGEAMLPPNAPLAAWPMPYRHGTLNISFAAGNAFGGGAGQVDVSLYDTAGRRVRTLANGTFAPGFHTTTWDGRDSNGRLAPAGIYFLNLQVEGQTRQMKVVVAPLGEEREVTTPSSPRSHLRVQPWGLVLLLLVGGVSPGLAANLRPLLPIIGDEAGAQVGAIDGAGDFNGDGYEVETRQTKIVVAR